MRILMTSTALLLAATALLASNPAQAAGCGGYVNVFVSGCAPWDNNPRRMPGAPGYQAPRAATLVVQTRIAQPQTPPRVVQPATGNRFISDQGGGLISNNRGGVIARDGASLISNSRGGVVSNGGPWR